MKTIPTDLFRIPVAEGSLSRGKLLVAQPLLAEECFCHSVILLVDYGENDGALGTVLNHPTGAFLHEVLSDFPEEQLIEIYHGGPLNEDRLYFLHSLGTEIIPDSTEVTPGVWIGGDFDAVKSYIAAGYPVEGFVRFFVGYSGWSRGQLEEELKSRTWALADSPQEGASLLLDSSDFAWHKALKLLGHRYSTWKYFPKDLRSN